MFTFLKSTLCDKGGFVYVIISPPGILILIKERILPGK